MKQHLYIIFVILSGILVCCTNPFKTRADQVETPNSDNVGYENPTTFELVFINFELALQDTVANVVEYANCLSPMGITFTYEPEPYFFEEFSARRWGKADEEAFYRKFKSTVSRVNFNFKEPLEPKPFVGTDMNDSLQIELTEYEIKVDFNPDSVKIFKGKSSFKLRKNEDQQKWYIYYWRDQAIDNDYFSTMTALKSQFKD